MRYRLPLAHCRSGLTARQSRLSLTGLQGGNPPPAGFQETCRLEDFDWSASITLVLPPDEQHAFGVATPLVAEWWEVGAGMGGGSAGSTVDRAVAAVRRWELETEMLRDFQLTLPPETEPLDEPRRKDNLQWREEALAEARRELSRAMRTRLFRRVVTLGLWRR